MKKEHVTGDNSHGFSNEKELVNALNEKTLKNLNTHLKRFIQQICEDYSISNNNMTIKAYIATRQVDPYTNKKINVKPDFYIEIGNQQFGISTKMGSGNSVHQESVDSFISWIRNNKNIIIADESIYNCLKLLIWGDGTLNGSAPVIKDSYGFVIGRYSTREFKNLYPKEHKIIQNFLNSNAKEIIKRALFLGKTNNEVNYIYHGTSINGIWISQKDILNYNLNYCLNSNTFNVGRMSLQIYNADKKGTESGASKRGNIQFKYGTLEEDIQTLMLSKTSNIGTYEGNLEEFNFSKMMNKNRNHKFWSFLNTKLNLKKYGNYYIIKVEGHKYSRNAKKKVMCKSDNYIIETKNPLNKDFMLKNEYQLTESDLANISNYKIIPNSGISVKQVNSKKYTLTKLTVPNFISAFKDYLENTNYLCATMIFYCTENKVNENSSIAKNLDIDEIKFIEFAKSKFNITVRSLLDYESLKILKKSTKELLEKTIENNKKLKQALFTGKGWFDDPYFINFIYRNGSLTDEYYPPYKIDNGSGRSKGKYTIIIKPI